MFAEHALHLQSLPLNVLTVLHICRMHPPEEADRFRLCSDLLTVILTLLPTCRCQGGVGKTYTFTLSSKNKQMLE